MAEWNSPPLRNTRTRHYATGARRGTSAGVNRPACRSESPDSALVGLVRLLADLLFGVSPSDLAIIAGEGEVSNASLRS